MSVINPRPEKTQGIHHIAFVSKDTQATYDFYQNKLNMDLVHTENHRLGEGYFRHFFFDVGNDQMIGFFEINNVGEEKDFKTDLSTSLGVPLWANHIAFECKNKEHFDKIRTQANENGVTFLAQVDHDWLKSIYFMDPNGLMLEFTYQESKKKAPSESDKQAAYEQLFFDPNKFEFENKEQDVELKR